MSVQALDKACKPRYKPKLNMAKQLRNKFSRLYCNQCEQKINKMNGLLLLRMLLKMPFVEGVAVSFCFVKDFFPFRSCHYFLTAWDCFSHQFELKKNIILVSEVFLI